MEKFQLLAEVKHNITDVITLTVEAETEEEAFDKAKRALELFPRPHEEDGISYMYTEHRVFNNTEVVSIDNMEDVADAES